MGGCNSKPRENQPHLLLDGGDVSFGLQIVRLRDQPVVYRQLVHGSPMVLLFCVEME